ncbi:hypothetical protein KR018_005438, partial [Drosophila ironensis]
FLNRNIVVFVCLIYLLHFRLFWICVLIISGWNMINLFILIRHRYITDSVSIGVSTSYSRWTNTFPSVGICLSKNRITESFTNIVKQRFLDETPSYAHIRTLYDYVFINPNNLYLKSDFCLQYNSTCGVNILDMRRELFAHSCTEIMEKVYFAENLIPDCEQIFKFHELEMGYCFLANSLYDYPNIEKMPLRYTSLDKYRNLRLVLKSGLHYRYDLYINSPEDLPYFNAVFYTVTNEPSIHSFNVEEIHNNDGVMKEPIYQRMCKFPSESNDDGIFYRLILITKLNQYFKQLIYSFSNCLSKVRSEMEMELCNCTLFSHKYQSEWNLLFLQILRIKLISRQSQQLWVRDRVGYHMECLPSCMEQQISFVGSRENFNTMDESGNVVEIEIASPPTVRYYRAVTQTKLELIVAIGSVIGLFFGASIINLLEIISIILKEMRHMVKN